VTDVYRLVRADRADDVLSGEGARLYGGRWNPPGRAVVYASESRALAVLETFVHLTLEARTMRFFLYAITLPNRPRLQRQTAARQPRTLAASQSIGRAWIETGAAVALVVPSVIVPQEANYVLNAKHPQFAQIKARKREAFSFDERLWRR
jgi:RES domain-containing protein